MNESILLTIKKLLGNGPDYTYFDEDLIAHINTVFVILNQIGVGPEEVYQITDEINTWSEFITEDQIIPVKTYMAKRVQMMFDPPTNPHVAEATKSVSAELEWRLNLFNDPGLKGE